MSAEAGILAVAFKSFVTLFVTLDPVGLAPLFVALAGARPAADRRRLAGRAVLVAGGVLLCFAVGGSFVLARLGITLDAFRIAGGILLLLIAIDMVLAKHERETPEEAEESRLRSDVSVFPLAIPLMAGPAALTSVMILAAEVRSRPAGLVVVMLVCVVVLAMCYGALRAAGPLARALGRTGVNVITRVLGILLASLAVQYMADGIRALLSAA